MTETVSNSKQGQLPDQPMQNQSMDRLTDAFESSARRWELIVYPSLFAFIILAAYGFYLIYSLTKDVHYLALSVDSNMTVIASNLQAVSTDMSSMTANMRTISTNLTDISQKVGTLEPILTNMNSLDQTMDSMDRSMQAMTNTTGFMRSDISTMNHNFARPMSFMNTFMPW